MAKTPEEKAKEKALREAEEKKLESEAAELKAESDRVEAEQQEKEEAKRKEIAEREGTKKQEAMYSETQVKAMLKELVKEMKLKDNGELESLDEEDPYAQKTARLPRFVDASGKVQFVIAFKNKNIDEFFKDTVIQAYDVWNEQTKRNDPWVTAVYLDGTTMNVALHTLIKKSQKVDVDIVDVIKVDKSYSAGKTERAEVKDFSKQGTGIYVKMKVTQEDYSYKVRLPDGQEVIVGKEVINW